MTPAEARARMKARKFGPTKRQRAGVEAIKSKADTRARAMIERWQAGERQEDIALAFGVARCTVSQAISRYRARHPDCRPSLPGAAGVADPLLGNPTTASLNLLHAQEATS